MNKVVIKFAASTLVLGMTMVSCKPAADMSRPQAASANAARADQRAASAFASSQEWARKGSPAEALAFAEQAVEFSPRDVAYRLLLAELYMKNGRFNSAETSFHDVLSLDPGNARAGLNLALAQVALGKTGEALAQLQSLSATAAPGDLGLAFALAGDPRRAIEMLEPAARSPDADGRVRQNLALAYALAGDWQKAQTTAAQDVSPADLDARMQQWAAFARPSAPWDQVASLLGVTAVEDAGQPVRLALTPAESDASAYAEMAPVAEPEPAPVPEISEPVQAADLEVPAWAPPAEAPVEIASVEETVRAAADPVVAEYTPAVEALVSSQPEVRLASTSVGAAPPTFTPAPRESVRPARPARAAVSGPGRFVVQIGAFSSAAGVERAWANAYRRYGLGDHQPRSTTVNLAGRGTFHRLSVAGFGTHGEASRTCRSIRAKGGACFVRAVAGDAPVRWASRYASRRPA